MKRRLLKIIPTQSETQEEGLTMDSPYGYNRHSSLYKHDIQDTSGVKIEKGKLNNKKMTIMVSFQIYDCIQ